MRDWRDDKIDELERQHAARELQLELERDVLRAETAELRSRLAKARATLAAVAVEVEMPSRLAPEPDAERVDESELRRVTRQRGI